MATIYRKKSPLTGKMLANYYCFFRVPDGNGGTKQIHKATGKPTKKQALEAAALFEKEALNEAGAGDEKSAAILGKLKEAGELAMRGRLNPARARELIGEIMEIGGNGEKLPEFTVSGWIDEWLRDKKATAAPATHAAYSTATKLFLASIGPKSDGHLEGVTAPDVRKFRDSIRSNGRTGKTANVQLKIIRSCFADAVRAHALLRNPAAEVKTIDENDSTTRVPFTVDEASALLKRSPNDEWRGVILLALYAGLRLGDAARVTAGDIDLDKGVVRFMPEKTRAKKRRLEIPLHTEIARFFGSYPLPPFAAAPVFPSLSCRRVGGKHGLSIEFGTIMDAAKVPRMVTRTSEDGAARMVAARSFHSLRHTTASLMANAGIAQEERMKVTGHTTASTHSIYTHHELERIRQAVDSMPSLPTPATSTRKRRRSA